MTGSVGAAVAVAADRTLVAETLSAALAASGLEVVRIPWEDPRPSDAPSTTASRAPADRAILLCDLDPVTIVSARRLVRAYPSRWLLLTDAPRGPGWGALLDVGVVDVLPSSITLDDLLTALANISAGQQPSEVEDRDELVEAWRQVEERSADARARLSTLTRREREVIELLGSGRTVPQIAELHGVSPSTVRSQVRSVLRKLGVHSQLAAVTVLLRAEGRSSLSSPRPAARPRGSPPPTQPPGRL